MEQLWMKMLLEVDLKASFGITLGWESTEIKGLKAYNFKWLRHKYLLVNLAEFLRRQIL